MKNRVPMWLPILTNYLWQCRGNLRQYLSIVDQISKTSLSDSLTESPTWIQEMLAHLKSISWGIISECSVLGGLGWARSECRGAWELESLLLYVLVLKSARYMGYKSEKWTPLNIYILYMICKLRSFHISPPNTQQPFWHPKMKKRFSSCQTSVGCETFFQFLYKEVQPEWQKLATIRRAQKWPQKFLSDAYLYYVIGHFLSKKRCFWPKRALSLPQVFQKVRKLQQNSEG